MCVLMSDCPIDLENGVSEILQELTVLGMIQNKFGIHFLKNTLIAKITISNYVFGFVMVLYLSYHGNPSKETKITIN